MSKEDIYVVVAENDQSHRMPNGSEFYDGRGPIVLETYTKGANFEKATAHIAKLSGKHGKCRIARLEFIEGEV